MLTMPGASKRNCRRINIRDLFGYSGDSIRGTVYLIEAVRRWLWGIHLLQRLRVPPGCPRLPRMPVVMLLQLGAPTLGLRKRTPQSHLLFVGICVVF